MGLLDEANERANEVAEQDRRQREHKQRQLDIALEWYETLTSCAREFVEAANEAGVHLPATVRVPSYWHTDGWMHKDFEVRPDASLGTWEGPGKGIRPSYKPLERPRWGLPFSPPSREQIREAFVRSLAERLARQT